MKKSIRQQLETIESELRRKFRAFVTLPRGVPPEVRLEILREEMKVLAVEPEAVRLRELYPDSVTIIDGCGETCPTCRIRPWCEFHLAEGDPAKLEWLLFGGEGPFESLRDLLPAKTGGSRR